MDSDIEIALKRKTSVDLFSKLLLDYYFYTNVFSILELDKLLFYQSYNYAINLELGIKPNHKSLYKMLRDKLLILKEYFEDNLHK